MLNKCLVVGIGGFLGANARFLVGQWLQQQWGPSFPWGTFVINVSGSLILGFFSTLALRFVWNDNWRLLIAIGFVGAYTTFSTFEWETLQLIAQGGRYRDALLNLAGSVLFGFVAAWLGVVLARVLLRGRL